MIGLPATQLRLNLIAILKSSGKKTNEFFVGYIKKRIIICGFAGIGIILTFSANTAYAVSVPVWVGDKMFVKNGQMIAPAYRTCISQIDCAKIFDACSGRYFAVSKGIYEEQAEKQITIKNAANRCSGKTDAIPAVACVKKLCELMPEAGSAPR